MKLTRKQLRGIIVESLNTSSHSTIQEGLLDSFSVDDLEGVIDKLSFILPDQMIEKLRNALDLYNIINPNGVKLSASEMDDIKARLDIPDEVAPASSPNRVDFDVDEIMDNYLANNPDSSAHNWPQWKKDAVVSAVSKIGTQDYSPLDYAKDIGSMILDKRNQ